MRAPTETSGTPFDLLTSAIARRGLSCAPLLAAALATAASVHAQDIYVDDDAPPGGDGESWATAYHDLQDALDRLNVRPRSGSGVVRIAQGIYVPDRGSGMRDMSFAVTSVVTLIGGFAGIRPMNPPVDPNTRDPARFETVLSGDLAQNDGPEWINRSDNSLRVVSIVHADAVTLNGLTLRAGSDTEPSQVRGGSLVGIQSATASIIDCVLTDGESSIGGAVMVTDSVLWMVRSRIVGCRAWAHPGVGQAVFGGAMSAFSSQVNLWRSRFERNSAAGAGDGWVAGGGIFTDFSTLEMAGCLVLGNSVVGGNTQVNGGGLCADLSTVHIANCRFLGNTAAASLPGGRASGGGLHASGLEFQAFGTILCGNRISGASAVGAGATIWANAPFSTSELTNCTVYGNAASGAAPAVGGVFIGQPAITRIVGTIMHANLGTGASFQQQVGAGTEGVLLLSRSFIAGATGSEGVAVRGGDPALVDPSGADGVLGTEDDDLRPAARSPVIDAADASVIPIDRIDLDSDGDYTELLTTDALGSPRLVNDAGMADIGVGTPAWLDIGALEFQGFSCRADVDGDASVSVGDLFLFLTDFFLHAPPADFNRSGAVTVQDLLDFIEAFVRGCP